MITRRTSRIFTSTAAALVVASFALLAVSAARAGGESKTMVSLAGDAGFASPTQAELPPSPDSR